MRSNAVYVVVAGGTDGMDEAEEQRKQGKMKVCIYEICAVFFCR
jgi:hypothetical protein